MFVILVDLAYEHIFIAPLYSVVTRHPDVDVVLQLEVLPLKE